MELEELKNKDLCLCFIKVEGKEQKKYFNNGNSCASKTLERRYKIELLWSLTHLVPLSELSLNPEVGRVFLGVQFGKYWKNSA